MTIAFFDLDKTLISVNSASLWLRSQWRSGKLTPLQMIRMTMGLVRYHLGFANLDDYIAHALHKLKGESDALVQNEIETFYHDQVRHHYRPGALEVLSEHRARGDRLALLTSSPHQLARLVAKELTFHDCLATELEVDVQGKYTGRTIGPVCFGRGKVDVAQKYAADLQVPLSSCSFYTDSVTDLPMLKCVGSPVVVNPDPRLRRAALVEKWKIVDWGAPNDIKRSR
jgi:HAD superfamily hydrolase (TIGR01490 family)